MDNYEKQEQLDKLFREQIRLLLDKTLADRLTQNFTHDTLLYLLIEANHRKDPLFRNSTSELHALRRKPSQNEVASAKHISMRVRN